MGSLIIIAFAVLLVTPQLFTRKVILGSDSIFHYNRFYEAAMQLKNGNLSYFLSLYGFQQSGRIVNISSVWGVCGASCEAAYSASKGGVGALPSSCQELRPPGDPGQCHCLRRHRYGNERVSVRRRGRSAPGRDPRRPHGAAGRGGRCGLCHDRIPGLPHRPDPPSGRGVDLIQRRTVLERTGTLGSKPQDSGGADSGLWIGLLADMDSGLRDRALETGADPGSRAGLWDSAPIPARSVKIRLVSLDYWA